MIDREMSIAEQSVEYLKKEGEQKDQRIAQLEKQLEEQGSRDVLTDLYNRRVFLDILSKLQPRDKSTGKKLSLLFLDIDHFKQINDTHGHAAGDKVLQAVAKYLKSKTRDRDVIGRWGGEEIVIAFNDAEAKDILNKFHNKKEGEEGKSQINLEVDLDGTPVQVTLSGGLTDVRADERLEESIKRADEIMYKAKGAGRNQIFKEE